MISDDTILIVIGKNPQKMISPLMLNHKTENDDFTVTFFSGESQTCKEKDLKKSIKEILQHKGTVLADFWVEEEENVFPMVPAGEAINRMIGGMA